MKKNKFKIIIASYNNEDWVEYNIASILNQTYDNYEVIYVDDCSSDRTNELVTALVGNNDKFNIIRNEQRVGEEAIYNYIRFFDSLEDDEIVINMCGDDWLFDENVINKINEYYNNNNVWMTYGQFYVYDGTPMSEKANPQNTPYSNIAHEYKLYRKDVWRASHLLTIKGHLAKLVDPNDLKSLKTGKYYYHAPDLALVFPLLEMCGKDRIGVVDFPTYVWNASESCRQRTAERESSANVEMEIEIRNRKVYKQGLLREKLPQINAIGGSREDNSVPKKFTYVYNLEDGEFDATIFTDTDIIRYINGEIPVKRGKIIADIHEPPHLHNHNKIYDKIYENHSMFDLILTYDERILQLPNSKFRNGGGEVLLSRDANKNKYINLYNENLFSIYKKNKLVSFITSNKTFNDWHKFRIKCVNHLINNQCKFSLYGVGFNEIIGKIDGLKDYAFSIAIENGDYKNYFTEKILDCFLTGTIPIYKGCPNINDFFDINGIITFEDENDLQNIVDNLTMDDYKSRLDSIANNFKLATEWRWDNDIIFEKYIKDAID
jgi:glycosyltransferase involved in cell wall biosynthesis